jgi:hypothetical protein
MTTSDRTVAIWIAFNMERGSRRRAMLQFDGGNASSVPYPASTNDLNRLVLALHPAVRPNWRPPGATDCGRRICPQYKSPDADKKLVRRICDSWSVKALGSKLKII